MSRKIIAIDVDDVLADTTETVRQQVNQKLGIELTAEHYRVPGDMWGYYERVWKEHGLEGKYSIGDHDAEWALDQMHVPLLPGAAFAISELSKKYDIILMTACHPAWDKARTAWMREHFGEQVKSLHFAGRIIDDVSKSKGEMCRELGVSYLIDDATGNYQSALEHGVTPILFGNYGWHHDRTDDMTHCPDWPSVLEWFSEHE